MIGVKLQGRYEVRDRNGCMQVLKAWKARTRDMELGIQYGKFKYVMIYQIKMLYSI